MDYLSWSNEYYNTANELSEVVERLKAIRQTVNSNEKKELDSKIAQYKIYLAECLQTANHLLLRHKGVE